MWNKILNWFKESFKAMEGAALATADFVDGTDSEQEAKELKLLEARVSELEKLIRTKL